MATVIAGPGAARHLADFGAKVTKVEAPGGDAARRLGWSAAGEDSYYWKLHSRGKTSVTLNLKKPDDHQRFLDLVASADAVVENMRPGKLEALGLGPKVLMERNPALVLLRVTAFGQTGPYSHKPGFATLAEAMSSFAAMSGDPDGKPLLPPVALTDEVTALAGAFAVMVGLHQAQATGRGQQIDVNLLETMIQLLGPLPSVYAHEGYEQPRLSGGIPYTVPRGTYQCSDNRWIAVSSSSDRQAAGTIRLLGLDADERFATFAGRAACRDELEAAMSQWAANHNADDAIALLEAEDCAVAPVYSMSELFADPHVQERKIFSDHDGTVQQGPVARFI